MSFLGTLVSDFKKDAGAVKTFILKIAGEAPAVVATIATDEAKVENLVEAFFPASTTVFAVGDTIIDLVAQAVEDSGPAAGANGLSVSFDQKIVADIKAVIAAAKNAKAAVTPAPKS